MTNPDDNRAAFEAWALSSGWFIGYELDKDESGEYEYCSVQRCWLAWQAAIEHAASSRISAATVTSMSGCIAVEPHCECHERDGSYVCKYCRSQGLRGHMER